MATNMASTAKTRMKMKSAAALIAVALLTMLSVGRLSAQSGYELFQKALAAEHADGNLRHAIQLYERVVKEAGRDRALAARALVRMAECYQNLGDVQARKIYEQVVRDYAEQKEAVARAQARLEQPSTVAPAGGIALRKIWTDDNVEDIASFFGGISTDGRYFSHAGRFNTAVMLRDMISGTQRTLISAEDHGTDKSTISKSGKDVAYDWCGSSCELWVSSLNESGSHGRRVFGNDDVISVKPRDWSPDDRRIAAEIRRRDRSVQIGLVTVADGSFQPLKSVDWRGVDRMFFSPDGKMLAFDLPEGDGTDDRDVFVLAVDGSREIPAVVSPGFDEVIGWTPDGRGLLFASDRSGAMDLWVQPLADGRPQGRPSMLKANVGNVFPIGVTRTGTLFMSSATWNQDIEIASIDIAAGTGTAAPVKPISRFIGANTQPAWSPDGTLLAYRSARRTSLATGAAIGESVIGVRSMTTGESRELHPALAYFQGLTWSPDARSLVVWGVDLKGREGIFRIDAVTSALTPIVVPISDKVPVPNGERLTYEGFSWSPDGRRLYYHTRNGMVHERDLASGTTRVIAGNDSSNSNLGNGLGISLSPDGQVIAALRPDSSGTALVMFPAGGGEPRMLFHVDRPAAILKDISWMPDGRSLLALKLVDVADGITDATRNELWQLSIDGAPPRRLDIDVSRVVVGGQGRIRLHPDGKQLTYVSGHYPVMELWVLENFLPAPTTPKQTARK